MSGTIIGGKKAAKTNLERHGNDYYSRIGHKGGKRSTTGGFASKKVGKDGLTGLERAKLAGAKGGRKSKRKSKNVHDNAERVTSDNKLHVILRNFIPNQIKEKEKE